MPVYNYEGAEGRLGRITGSGKGDSVTIPWVVLGDGTTTELQAFTEAENALPSMYDGLIFETIELVEYNHGANSFLFSGTYINADAPGAPDKELPTGEFTFEFDTAGGTATKYISEETTAAAMDPTRHADVPNTPNFFEGAISVDPETREPRGIEVPVPGLKITCRYRMPRASLTIPYIRGLASMRGHTNDAPWHGFEKDELLFLNASGSQRYRGDCNLRFEFLVDHTFHITLPWNTQGFDPTIEKPPHHAAWWYYRDTRKNDQQINKVFFIRKPVRCNIERIYPRANFPNVLGF